MNRTDCQMYLDIMKPLGELGIGLETLPLRYFTWKPTNESYHLGVTCLDWKTKDEVLSLYICDDGVRPEVECHGAIGAFAGAEALAKWVKTCVREYKTNQYRKNKR